jgi:apolipoprotein N-acyltransferase
MVLITNDGWWSSSGGYLQHLALARLRAIETGLWVARCANTGVSAVIDFSGDIIQSAAYGQEAMLYAEIPLLKPDTFFVRHQKIIQQLPLFLLFISILWVIFDQHLVLKTFLYINKKCRS